MTSNGPNSALAASIAQRAHALGFCRVGFASCDTFARGEKAWTQWLQAGHHGSMGFMAKYPWRADPRGLLKDARTLVSVAMGYPGPGPEAEADAPPAATTAASARGTVAAYAKGRDYHQLLHEKLRALAQACEELAPQVVKARPCVDSAPILEREAAARAGLGFIGKSTMQIIPGVGSYLLLGELLLNVPLPLQTAPQRDRCGSCTACLDACPTGAFVGPYQLDARRCIAYLTIEHGGSIPHELRPLMGARVFGCDVCQQVCPFNASKKPRPHHPQLVPLPHLRHDLELVDLLQLRSSGYRRLVSGTSMRRVSRNQLARNAAVALGNVGNALEHSAPLANALAHHTSWLVRGHAAWALGRLGGTVATQALNAALQQECEPQVLEEIRLAL